MRRTVIALLIILAASAADEPSPGEVAPAAGPQIKPAIHGYRMVWIDYRHEAENAPRVVWTRFHQSRRIEEPDRIVLSQIHTDVWVADLPDGEARCVMEDADAFMPHFDGEHLVVSGQHFDTAGVPATPGCTLVPGTPAEAGQEATVKVGAVMDLTTGKVTDIRQPWGSHGCGVTGWLQVAGDRCAWSYNNRVYSLELPAKR